MKVFFYFFSMFTFWLNMKPKSINKQIKITKINMKNIFALGTILFGYLSFHYWAAINELKHRLRPTSPNCNTLNLFYTRLIYRD